MNHHPEALLFARESGPRRFVLRESGPRRFALRDENGFTGAERALLVCFGLAIVVLVGALVRGGSSQAAGDAARALRDGQGGLGAMASTATLSSSQMIHAAGLINPPGSFARAPEQPAPRLAPAPDPAPPPVVPKGALTIGDTASVKRTTTDKVYQHNLGDLKQAQVNITDSEMKSDLAAFVRNWNKNQARYEAVAEKTGVPAKLIAAIHWREASGNWNTYLEQGDPLGKPAVHVPRNIPVFFKWEDAAIYGLNMKKSVSNDLGMTAQTTDLAAMATYAEYYNGLGYYNKGRTSPYVYSGTNQYTKGKYVGDGVYDPNARDHQLGVIAMIEAISDGVQKPQPVAPQPPVTPQQQPVTPQQPPVTPQQPVVPQEQPVPPDPPVTPQPPVTP